MAVDNISQSGTHITTLVVDGKTYVVGMTSEEYSNVNNIVSNETTRQTQESKRESNESTRKSNESTRSTNEANRKVNETARTLSEAQRDTSEAIRDLNETSRKKEASTLSKALKALTVSTSNDESEPAYNLLVTYPSFSTNSDGDTTYVMKTTSSKINLNMFGTLKKSSQNQYSRYVGDKIGKIYNSAGEMVDLYCVYICSDVANNTLAAANKKNKTRLDSSNYLCGAYDCTYTSNVTVKISKLEELIDVKYYYGQVDSLDSTKDMKNYTWVRDDTKMKISGDCYEDGINITYGVFNKRNDNCRYGAFKAWIYYTHQ